MIKTLSPYKIYVPLVNPLTDIVCESFTIKLFIWAGNKTAVPSLPEYEKTIINASVSNQSHELNISRIINDFIDFNIEPSLVTSLENSDNQVWVAFMVFYNDLPEIPQHQFVQLAVKGYGYFREGENPDVPTNKILININDYKVNRNGIFVLPIELDETPPTPPEIEITSVDDEGGGNFNLNFTSLGTYVSLDLRVHIVGDDVENDLIFNFPPTSPIPLLLIPIDPTDYEFTLTGFDIVTDTLVTSNVFEFSIL